MKWVFLFFMFTTLAYALIEDTNEDCIVLNPIGNTIITAGERMKISWANSHAENFTSIYLVQADGQSKPITIAEHVPTSLGHIRVQLPFKLTPSNAYYMTLGEAPYHCQSGNLRIVGATSTLPDPKPPSTLEDQISSGRFPHRSPNASYKFTSLSKTSMFLFVSFTSFVVANFLF